ncbi:MAG: GLUG motif-containing protein [Planctomycetota bacterium]|jgi:hypothetical protein
MTAARNSRVLRTIPLLITIFSLSFPAQAEYGGGSGEPNDPYLIYTAGQMNNIGAEPNDWDKHFKLMENTDLSGYVGNLRSPAFNIIGRHDWPFTGTFDGNGKAISNFRYSSTDTNYIGIFGCVGGENALIKDLGLINPNVDAGTSVFSYGGQYIGSLAGNLQGGTITNCYVEGGSIAGKYYVGGLVGDNSGTITNCYAQGGSVMGGIHVGGLVGSNAGTISNCYAKDGNVSGNDNVGGLVGKNYATISNCHSGGDVSGGMVSGPSIGPSCSGIGGLVGESSGTITNCYSIGGVTGTGTGSSVGGLVGVNHGSVTGSFWDVETAGRTYSAAGTGKTTAQMHMESTFVGWGCEPAWTIDEGADYPRLAWENMPGKTIVAPSYHGTGSGTQDDPYLLYTAEELNMIGVFPCELDKHFKLMSDIDLSHYVGTQFNMIGKDSAFPFTGVFDGNGHTVSNFTYTSTDCVGLFGYIDTPNAHVKDLGLIDPNVESETGRVVGSLAGRLREGTITNCYVVGGSVSGADRVGGLIGVTSYGTITNCYAQGVSVSGADAVGGLIGVTSYGTITNCYAQGGSVSGTRFEVGGLVGYNGGLITNCYAQDVSVSGADFVGGLLGGNGGTISNCHAQGGSVSGTGFEVGGLVGRNWWEGTITNCYAQGLSVIRTEFGGFFVGGLVGANDGLITNCYAQDGSVMATGFGGPCVGGLVGANSGTVTNCYSAGSVSGRMAVGGLVGLNTSSIATSYSSGTVTGNEDVGGLVGDNNGTITNCYSTAGISGATDVGGLVGSNGSVSSPEASVTNSYSIGTVSGNWRIGGLVGYDWSSGSITSSFWDTETSGQATSAGGTGKTTTEMQTASTFLEAGWDFVDETANGTDDIWWTLEGQDYPRLWWEAHN